MRSSDPPFGRPPRAFAALLLTLAALLLTACGGDGSSSQGPDAASGPATVTPPDALAYGELLVRPRGELEEGVVTAARRVLRVEDPGRELLRLLDEGSPDVAQGEFSRRFEPLLGDSIGAFALLDGAARPQSPDYGVAFGLRDRDAAARELEREAGDGTLRRGGTYDGIRYYVGELDSDTPAWGAVVGDFLVLATPSAFRASVAASKGGSLADERRFADAAEALPGDRLAWGYLEPSGLVGLIRRQARLDPDVAEALEGQQQQLEQALGSEPITAALTARADQIAFDLTSDSAQVPAPGGEGSVSVGRMPGDAWAAFGTPALGEAIAGALRDAGQFEPAARAVRQFAGLDLDRDLLGWLGGIGGFARGSSPLELGGGIVIASRDAAASQRFVDRVERFAGALGLPTTPTTGVQGRGFQLKLPDLPAPIVVIAQEDRVVVGLGMASARDALEPDEALADTEPGKSAIASLGDGFEASFVLVPGPLMALLEALGIDRDPGYRSAKPYLSAYSSLVAGSKERDGRVTARLVLNLQDPDGR